MGLNYPPMGLPDLGAGSLDDLLPYMGTDIMRGPATAPPGTAQAGGLLAKLLGIGGGPLGMAALSFAPALLSKLFGGNAQRDRYERAMAAISPEAIHAAQQRAIKEQLNSQGFHMANRMAMMGGQAAMGHMAGNLAKNGMSHSGIGSVVPALGNTAITQQRGLLGMQAQQYGMQQGHDDQFEKMRQMLGYNPGPSMTQSLLAGGFSALGPYLASRMPGYGGQRNVA